MGKGEFQQGIRQGLPICLGYFSVSMAFGMTAVLSGLPIWAAVLISLTNLTSAGQFAGTELILAGAGFLEIAMSTCIINSRYFLMSLSVSQKTEEKMTLLQRLCIAFGITDEIFAVSMQRPKNLSAAYMAGLILTPVAGWTGGTLAGAVLTSFLPEMISNALSIALYGMFIAVIVPPAKKEKSVLFVVLLAAAFSCLTSSLPFLSWMRGGWGIILITVLVSAFGALLFPVEEEEEV